MNKIEKIFRNKLKDIIGEHNYLNCESTSIHLTVRNYLANIKQEKIEVLKAINILSEYNFVFDYLKDED